jgi:nitroreductase/formate hydrogenlyase subunit 6/NADH:ubiquinone oxidoreductase subunit I
VRIFSGFLSTRSRDIFYIGRFFKKAALKKFIIKPELLMEKIMTQGILVDQNECTKCNICATICPMGAISPADATLLPSLPKDKEPFCIGCGHCEAVCPSGALKLAGEPGEGMVASTTCIDPDCLGVYLKSRRSVRHYKQQPVNREIITKILDIARFAASGGNGQPVEWLVIHDRKEVTRIAGLTIEWIRTLSRTGHPMANYAPVLVSAWESGTDVICRGAPHLIIPHIPADNPIAPTDGIIALTHVDITAPAFGVGTCWAGFVAGASASYKPLQEALDLPRGRVAAYAMMLGYPVLPTYHVPRRKQLNVTWR